mmetsp:Transcript_22118/g.57640  ORF Transcript_22118/g.57640 Transcript_22118/m.57640 type:complete len:237 (+) Transcript_22118:1134-1844(+)
MLAGRGKDELNQRADRQVHQRPREEAQQDHAAPGGGCLGLGPCLVNGDQVRGLIQNQEEGRCEERAGGKGVGDNAEGGGEALHGVSDSWDEQEDADERDDKDDNGSADGLAPGLGRRGGPLRCRLQILASDCLEIVLRALKLQGHVLGEEGHAVKAFRGDAEGGIQVIAHPVRRAGMYLVLTHMARVEVQLVAYVKGWGDNAAHLNLSASNSSSNGRVACKTRNCHNVCVCVCVCV